MSKNIENLSKSLANIKFLPKNTEEEVETINLSKEAESFLLSHGWCDSIIEGWLAESWGYILCVFLFKIESENTEVDDYVWIVVGDIPSAYIDIESAEDSDDVLQCYVDIMSDWVECIETNKSVEDCYPIEVPPTLEYASMLKSRLKIISEELI